MAATLSTIVTSEFFWGIVAGLVLSLIGSYALMKLQNNAVRSQQRDLIRRFAIDTVRNMKSVILDMNEVRSRTDAIHHDFLALMDNEIAVFNRNREHTIHLTDDNREKLRKFMNECSVRKAEVGNFLSNYYALMQLADQLQAQGQGPQSQRVRADANEPLVKANKAVDRLVDAAKEADGLANLISRDRGA